MKALVDVTDQITILKPGVYSTTEGAAPTPLNFSGVIANRVDVHVGTITDGVHTPSILDSPDGETWTVVDPLFLEGGLVPFASNTNQAFSYLGANQFLEVVTTVIGAPETGGAYGIVATVTMRKQP